MNKLCKEHLKGLIQDWKNFKLSKKEVIERIEILAEICYTQGLTHKEEPIKPKNNEFKNWVLSERAKGTPMELIQASVAGEAKQAVIKLIWDWAPREAQ